jgi:hypothetical protein
MEIVYLFVCYLRGLNPGLHGEKPVVWPQNITPVWDILGSDLCHDAEDFGALPPPG